nr:permease [uncultured Friedmanniella sp.]
MSTAVGGESAGARLRPLALTALALAVTALGLLWAKWLPYTDRVLSLVTSRAWEGTSVLLAGEGEPSLLRAWDFTVLYTEAVWKALAVALVVAASVDVLVPRSWLLRALGRRTPWRGSVAGGLAALPGMMCTCCTAPIAVTMRRAGVPTSATLAFWLGNPVLNPAVIIFLALLVPWPWVAVRVVLGLVLADRPRVRTDAA